MQLAYIASEGKKLGEIEQFHRDQMKRLAELKRMMEGAAASEFAVQEQSVLKAAARTSATIDALRRAMLKNRVNTISVSAESLRSKLIVLLDADDPSVAKEQLVQLAKILAAQFPVVGILIAVWDAKNAYLLPGANYNTADKALMRCETFTQAVFQWNLYCQLLIGYLHGVVAGESEAHAADTEKLQHASDEVLKRFQTSLDSGKLGMRWIGSKRP